MASETHRMLKGAFGDNALGQTQTYKRFKHFKNGWVPVDDEEHFRQPSTVTTTENVVEVQKAILEDQQWTIHDVRNIVRLLYGACQRILSDELNIRCIAAKFVPGVLNSDQKEYRISLHWSQGTGRKGP